VAVTLHRVANFGKFFANVLRNARVAARASEWRLAPSVADSWSPSLCIASRILENFLQTFCATPEWRLAHPSGGSHRPWRTAGRRHSASRREFWKIFCKRFAQRPSGGSRIRVAARTVRGGQLVAVTLHRVANFGKFFANVLRNARVAAHASEWRLAPSVADSWSPSLCIASRILENFLQTFC